MCVVVEMCDGCEECGDVDNYYDGGDLVMYEEGGGGRRYD